MRGTPRMPSGPEDDAEAWAHIAALQARVKEVADRRLAVGPDDRVLDVGAGGGGDVLRLAAAVGGACSVVGVDSDPVMVEAATRRARAQGLEARARFFQGDAHTLPFADGAFDAVRCERLLVHVADPARVIAEMMRVLRPGGRLVTAETDLATMSVDTDVPRSERVVRDVRSRDLRQPFAGRRVYGLCRAAGLRGVEVDVVTVQVHRLAVWRRMTGWDGACRRALMAGLLGPEDVAAIDEDLRARDRQGVFFAYGAYLVTSARRP